MAERNPSGSSRSRRSSGAAWWPGRRPPGRPSCSGKRAAASFAEGLAAYPANPLPILRLGGGSAPRPRRPARPIGPICCREWLRSTFFAAEALSKLGQIRQAESGFRRVVAVREAILARNPGHRQFAIDVARDFVQAAVSTANYRSAVQSLTYFDRAVEGFGGCCRGRTGRHHRRGMAANAYRYRAAASLCVCGLDERGRDAEVGLCGPPGDGLEASGPRRRPAPRGV